MDGPVLSIGVRSHCVVAIGSNEFLFLGGSTDGVSHTTLVLLFNYATFEWKVGPAMSEGRKGAACGYGRRQLFRKQLI